MPITSVIIEVVNGDENLVAERIGFLDKIEVQKIGQACLVAVTDTESIVEDRNVIDGLDEIEGVITSNVAFSNMEDCVCEID